MGLLGSQLGSALGGALGQKYGGNTGREIGSTLGKIGGAALPWFKKGGAVKKTGKAIVHKGEYVLPVGVKPTKAQKAAVAKKHKK